MKLSILCQGLWVSCKFNHWESIRKIHSTGNLAYDVSAISIRPKKIIVCFPFHDKIFMERLGGNKFYFIKYVYMGRIRQ